MTIVDSLKWRYATKKFDSSKYVSDDKIDILKQAFNLTATSYGLQPIKLVVVKNKKLQKKLVQFSMDQKQVAQASHLLVFCIINTIDKDYITKYFNTVKEIRNTPDSILTPFREFLIEDFKKKNQQNIDDWSTKQAYLALGNLLTVCAIEEIDACPMEGFSPTDYDRVLKLNDHDLSSVLVMPIGYRAEDDMFANFKKVRKELSDSVINL